MRSFFFRLGCGVLIAALLATAVGCGTGENNAVEPTAAPTAAETTETTQAPSETAEVSETTEEETENLSEWAAAYRKYLNKTIDDYDSVKDLYFGFFYLDGDEVPELWWTDGLGAHGYGYVIAAFRDGKVEEICSDANYLDYFEKQGVFLFTGSYSAAGGGGTYYKMTADGCDEIDNFEYEYKTADEVVYKINDVSVSETEYNGLRDTYVAQYGKATQVGAKEAGFPLTKDSVKQNCK